jgi:uncharacterized cupredoxin-like copper-binding protein
MPNLLPHPRRNGITVTTSVLAFALCLPVAEAIADEMPALPMNHAGGHQHAVEPQFSFGAPAPAGDATRIVAITMTNFAFTPAAITVQRGEVIRFVITNASGIHHEFTLGDTATATAHRAEMVGMTAADVGPMSDEPNAIVVKANETRELTWKFTQAGQLEYDCTIPGHYEVGMRGIIAVQ